MICYTDSVAKDNEEGQNAYHYMLEKEITRKAEKEFCEKIKSCSSLNVIWMSSTKCDQQYVVGFMQIYSDKLVTSLK